MLGYINHTIYFISTCKQITVKQPNLVQLHTFDFAVVVLSYYVQSRWDNDEKCKC